MNRLEMHLNKNGIEFRRGSAGGGSQLRQPYVRNIKKYKESDISENFPVSDHMHFFSMYIGNFPDLLKKEIDFLLEIINEIN